MKKRVFYSEAAYCLGLFLLALGTAMTVHGDFGISMVVAPAYILHLKLSAWWPWFSFGMAEYVLQALLLSVMMLLLKTGKLTCLLSFVSTVLYGLILDASTGVIALLGQQLWVRLAVYCLGVLLCTAGISFLFHSYLPPAAYELLVKVLSRKGGWRVSNVKTVYDCTSLLVAVVMSQALLGKLHGVGVGTVVCALIYGSLIRMFGTFLERHWEFPDRFGLREKLS